MTRQLPSVLVTGAAGYVGRLCIKALAGRINGLGSVVALDVAYVPEPARENGVHYERMDICDPSLAQVMQRHGINCVVHLASILRTPRGAPKSLAYTVDVLGTRNVLDASAEAGVTRLIVLSSGAAYGYYADNPAWLDEDDALRGNETFEYARNKRLVENMLADWRIRHPEIAQTVFRPGTIVGENVHSPVTDLFERPFVLGVSGSDSPFVFIWDEDLVTCIIEAIFNDKPGIFNQAGDGAVSPRDIARMLSKPYVPLPVPVLCAMLWVLKRLGLSESGPERIDFLRYRPVLANRRLKEEFGYTPRYTSLEAFRHYAQARGLIGKT